MIIVIFSVCLILYNPAFILHLGWNISNPFVNSLVFRSPEGVQQIEEITNTVYRTLLWDSHLNGFLQSPAIGIGTFKLDDVATNSYVEEIGSESFITNWLCRVGGLLTAFCAFILFLFQSAIKRGNKCMYLLLIVLIISMLFYGSFLVPYNFMYLLFFAALNNSYVEGILCLKSKNNTFGSL